MRVFARETIDGTGPVLEYTNADDCFDRRGGGGDEVYYDERLDCFSWQTQIGDYRPLGDCGQGSLIERAARAIKRADRDAETGSPD